MRHFAIGLLVCLAAFAALLTSRPHRVSLNAPLAQDFEDEALAAAMFGGAAEESDHSDELADEPLMETVGHGGIGLGAGGAYGGRRSLGINPTPSAPPTVESERLRTWQRSTLLPNTPRLKVGDEEELPLRAMQATVRIDAFRARVVLDCVYENDRDRQLEGNFELRLPNEASPFYLGFGETAPARLALPATNDVFAIRESRAESWTAPKEARIVPRARASRAYGEVVRRNVDPALLEWSGAGVFSARVFPLEPGKLHRVVVGYEVDLLPAGDELEYRLDLPAAVPDLRVDITVRGGPHRVTPAAEGADGRYVFEDPDARAFVVRVKAPRGIALVGADGAAGDLFAAFARPEVETAPAAPSRRATFLVDVSRSSRPDAIHVWLALLEEILTRNRAEIEEFQVLFFNVEAFWWPRPRASNTRDNVRELLEDARSLALEGATDLALALRTAAAGPPGDLFLLSDGAATWGEGDRHALAAMLGDRRLYAYSTGLAGGDTPLLSALARESGGALLSVVGEGEVAEAATAHRSRPWRLVRAEVEGCSDLLLAGRPASLHPGQTLFLAGRGRPAGPLLLTVEQGGRVRTLEVPLGAPIESDLAPGAYGRIAVSQLEEVSAPEAPSYALHFGVVGESCSLLMLESEEEYALYGISPVNDATAVRESPASAAVERTLADAGARLGDPKAAFLGWLDRLATTPGVDLALPPETLEAARGLPREAFDVRPEPLACRSRRGEAGGSVRAMMDEAARRLADLGPADALKALSTVVEESPGDAALAREVGYAAMEWGLGGQAYHLFRRVAAARPYEPHTFHAMALCLADHGAPDLALLSFEVARVGKWDGRFGDFARVLDLEYLRFLRAASEDPRCGRRDLARRRLGELAEAAAPRSADIVVVVFWNTDRTDVDLHVTDPNGEECYYEHRDTRIGGHLTTDVTQGYGPEMFVLERAVPGEYRVRVKYFAADATRASARTKVHATVYEDWGRPSERAKRVAVTLAEGKEIHDIASVRR